MIAGIEGYLTSANMDSWYYALKKPFFNPPSFVFAPVWTILYIMMGIAAGLIWHRRKKHPELLVWFILQLVFNFLWSLIFFVGESILWALVDILLLWSTLFITLIYAYKQYKKVAYCLMPYFIWVSFAAVINFSLWILN